MSGARVGVDGPFPHTGPRPADARDSPAFVIAVPAAVVVLMTYTEA
ncbi:hypothetical protein GCM10012280_64000 [Wenjunlia tyrosinilytica]|uniref:Uncharacterized protein n=1 Tax=Wenjunlia tyrosinilytica TaxID=1544741 RepID=A0A917ZXS6_9ACTN|nr:hypothetical protein GCM10012280_64000 [Wenjunlia tyrosinilytica]